MGSEVPGDADLCGHYNERKPNQRFEPADAYVANFISDQ